MPANLTSRLILAATLAWTQVLQLGPYVAGGILLAVLLGQLDLLRFWRHRLSPKGGKLNRIEHELWTVLGTACLGGVSPLCTYGTVPILMELLRGGASPGPAIAFLVASSMLNPQLFLLIIGGLGVRLALAQAAGVILLSGTVGLMASCLRPSLLIHPAALSTSAPSSTAPRRFSWSGLGHDLLAMSGWVGFTFITGVILAGILQVFIPARWVAGLVGEGRWAGVLLSGLLSIPFYSCGGGAVPALAGLTQAGMSPAAVLAFLLSGPATRVTALAAMGSLLNRRALVIYVVYAVVGSVLIGLMLG